MRFHFDFPFLRLYPTILSTSNSLPSKRQVHIRRPIWASAFAAVLLDSALKALYQALKMQLFGVTATAQRDNPLAR